jgi:hypothetical protein
MYDLALVVLESETKNPAHATLGIYGVDPTAYLSLAPPLFNGHVPPSSHKYIVSPATKYYIHVVN